MGKRAAVLVLMLGCDDGGGGNTTIIDTGVEVDMAPTSDLGPVADGGGDMGEPLPLDRGVPPEARCWARGAVPGLSFESDPLPGAQSVRADVDADGDALPDILLAARDPGGLRLSLLNGRTAEELGVALLPGVEQASFMPELWPAPELVGPVGGRFVVWSKGEGGEALRLLGPDLAAAGAVALPGPASRVQVVVLGEKLFALVRGADNSCAIFDLDAETERMRQGSCRLRPGWDVNGDGVPELVRSGGDGTHLLDGVSLESIANHPGALVLSPEPADLRGQGLEVAGVGEDMGRQVVHYLDPIDLSQNVTPPIPIALRGEIQQVEIRALAQGQRVVVDDGAAMLRYLKLIEPGAMLRPRSELGSYRFLSWALDTDIDADGVPELRVVGGSGEDGTNTPVAFHRLQDGEEIFTFPAERSARFTTAFRRGPVGLGVPADLDGCEGSEYVSLRLGNVGGDGRTPSRVQVLGQNGDVVWRSEGYNGVVHSLAVADLDGMPPAELLELRSDEETAGAARLRIFTGGVEAP